MAKAPFSNPFKPGAGHKPPYLAGREHETTEFKRLLKQDVILDNLILTGLRGVGKTVLLDTFKPLAIASGWLWVGTDLSEAVSLSEERVAIRLLTDLAVVTSTVTMTKLPGMGFHTEDIKLDFATLQNVFNNANGLVADKLKAVLELVWECLKESSKTKGLIFAYDEAQNMADHAEKEEYPLSLLLDVFQSIQKKNIPFMLVLVGLPTLFPKLVEARTFAERMFRVIFLDRLSDPDCKDAITKPIQDAKCPVRISEFGVTAIIEASGGYPYFIQFICRETYDAYLQRVEDGKQPTVSIPEITRKLDTDFFSGRWAKATDRQRELLIVIAHLDSADDEFTVQEISEESKKRLPKPFGSSHINQMLLKLADAGLVYKNRHGKYSFAVPLFGHFIIRQENESAS